MMLILKEKWYIAKFLWLYISRFFYLLFFLALVSKSKKQYKYLSKRTVEKSWKIERRDCCKFSSEKEPKKKKPQRALIFFCFLKAIHDLNKPVVTSEYMRHNILDEVLEKDRIVGF